MFVQNVNHIIEQLKLEQLTLNSTGLNSKWTN